MANRWIGMYMKGAQLKHLCGVSDRRLSDSFKRVGTRRELSMVTASCLLLELEYCANEILQERQLIGIHIDQHII